MTEREGLERAVYGAVDALNKQLPEEIQIEKSPDAPLYGSEGKLESLDFVTFIMEVETKVREELGIELFLTDEDLLSKQKSPFATLGTLINYLEKEISSSGGE